MEFEPSFNRYDSSDESSDELEFVDSEHSESLPTNAQTGFKVVLDPQFKISALNIIPEHSKTIYKSLDSDKMAIIGAVFDLALVTDESLLSLENTKLGQQGISCIFSTKASDKSSPLEAYLLVSDDIDQARQYSYIAKTLESTQPQTVSIKGPDAFLRQTNSDSNCNPINVASFDQLYRRQFYSPVVAESALRVGLLASIENYCSLRNIHLDCDLDLFNADSHISNSKPSSDSINKTSFSFTSHTYILLYNIRPNCSLFVLILMFESPDNISIAELSFYNKVNWRHSNLYSAFSKSAQDLLSLNVPNGLFLSSNNSSASNFKSEYLFAFAPKVSSSIGVLSSSIPLPFLLASDSNNIPNSTNSNNNSTPSPPPKYLPDSLDLINNPEYVSDAFYYPSIISKIDRLNYSHPNLPYHENNLIKDSNYLLFSHIYPSIKTVTGTFISQFSPHKQFKASWSSQISKNPKTLQNPFHFVLQYAISNPSWSFTTCFSSVNSIIGSTATYNIPLASPPSHQQHSSLPNSSPIYNWISRFFRKSRFTNPILSFGSEIYYGINDTSGALSLGAKLSNSSVNYPNSSQSQLDFSTTINPDFNSCNTSNRSGADEEFSLIINPLMGHTSFSYFSAMPFKNFKTAVQYDINFFSYLSELSFGFEYGGKSHSAQLSTNLSNTQDHSQNTNQLPINSDLPTIPISTTPPSNSTLLTPADPANSNLSNTSMLQETNKPPFFAAFNIPQSSQAIYNDNCDYLVKLAFKRANSSHPIPKSTKLVDQSINSSLAYQIGSAAFSVSKQIGPFLVSLGSSIDFNITHNDKSP
ncbi:Mitochondrial distribution and morphology protein 10, partial [Smittium culicis]